jgi:drug/metabolite transporter (DMT)-like permease
MSSIGLFYAMLASITWGLVYTLDQKILERISLLTLLIINSTITLLICVPLVFLIKRTDIIALTTSGGSLVKLMVMASLFTLVANFFMFTSIKQMNAATASMLEISYPFFVVLFSFLILKAPLNISVLIGGVLIFFGSLIIIRFN